ncbi:MULTISPECIES: Ppx/GppA phosphatase family protein [Actinomadura]|uniref:Exopolyphosphatase / guanosine-5'-triphosphate,3'-diphosphate pyrophosphatase n=1 Tax=Actinomadura madurae TaxID=1993 RepID=A0A1I5D153_9ACTN|nr:Ppx/GppA phosphatase family protein [Actinomadura madurae]MCP9950271.1 Ppx/GppA family phosphatase [Actinomadura madurae]MCP9967052.1 Ppx/GppA family phosphatase [Actinomadura madurae]MCQ0015725.1 Ppx/GppA family phosphatase [Actinomadura madurae]URM95828.1 Ppx/GppA family phosphatase [Actinomadura madurae]URN06524.1 Ppx/GppA family phosphatase [Actinomadura madurae]
MTRVAAIDCGTNSVRLLIADIVPGGDGGAGGTLTDVERRMEIVRLGEGVDETGRLSPAALERTFTAMRGYAGLIDRHGAGAGHGPIKTRVVATSATRDAANRADFVRGVVDIFGVVPEVISGDEEAGLSFTGATRELAALRPARPYLVVDIGGGSTEFVLGSSSADAARSIDIGCVRMTERHLKDDPPSPQQISGAAADIDAALAAVRETVPVDEARTLVGLAGSVTTVAGIALGLPEYDASRIHLSRITAGQVHEVTRRLLHATRAERAEFGVMHPGRVDVIGAGALILDRIMREYGFGAVVVSEHDILDGIAWSLV